MSERAGFSTRRVAVLGAGFGGLTIASELNPHAVAGDADVTVVDRNAHFSVGFSMQWAIMGRRTPEQGQRPYALWRMPGAPFV